MVKKRGSHSKKPVKTKSSSTVFSPSINIHSFDKFEKEIKNLSEQELRELLMINMYKMALLRSQIETLNNILIKNRLTTYEEIWKDTNENFKNTI